MWVKRECERRRRHANQLRLHGSRCACGSPSGYVSLRLRKAPYIRSLALMKIGEDGVYPQAAFMDEAAKHCRASSGMRRAAIVKWSHKMFHTLVMVRAIW